MFEYQTGASSEIQNIREQILMKSRQYAQFFLLQSAHLFHAHDVNVEFVTAGPVIQWELWSLETNLNNRKMLSK